MEYTYAELVRIAEAHGANLADVAIGRMMDMVEEDTGVYPSWSDTAPQWVVDSVI